MFGCWIQIQFSTLKSNKSQVPSKFFVWQLDSIFVFKSKHCTTNIQIQYFENIFLMFSFLLFCTQVYCLIKNIYFLFFIRNLSFSLTRHCSRRQSLPRPTWLSVVFAAVTWLHGGRLGFTDLRLISPSPNVARERTSLSLSLSLSQWSFVSLWSPVVGFC